MWGVDIDDCVKLLTTIFYFKYERKLKRAGKSPGEILQTCEGSISDYVNVVRFLVLKLGPTRATSTCPGLESMRLQSERANAVMGYWQDGFKESMPRRDFNGKGWGVDSKSPASSSEELTAENCVMWLSEHTYMDIYNETRKLACSNCDPDTSLCNRCGCRDRTCTLACSCRGNCRQRSPPNPSTPPVATTSALVSQAARAFMAQVATGAITDGSGSGARGVADVVVDDDDDDDSDDER